jgi:hypothetical protein
MHKERTARRISFQISTLRTRKKEQHSGRSGGKTKLQKYPPKHTHTSSINKHDKRGNNKSSMHHGKPQRKSSNITVWAIDR